jgi:hypothetical protein
MCRRLPARSVASMFWDSKLEEETMTRTIKMALTVATVAAALAAISAPGGKRQIGPESIRRESAGSGGGARSGDRPEHPGPGPDPRLVLVEWVRLG